MKYFLIITLSIFALVSKAQNTAFEGGYIYVTDQESLEYDADRTYTYYITPYMECNFPSDVNEKLLIKKGFDEAFLKFVAENYELENMGEIAQGEWLMPGRGVYPDKQYEKKLEHLQNVGPGGGIVVIEGFQVDCQ